jgi:cell division protein FtsQ
LDEHGKILEHDGIGEFGNLPIVVGEDAEKHAKHLLFVLNQFPKIRKQLVCAIFIGKRRWDIKINKGVLIKFPEKHLKHAMTILDEISDDKGFFKDDIEEIDLRMLDRVIVKTNNGKKK